MITGGTSIGDHAFYGCSALTSITLPESLTSIGERTFENCTSLASITIPDGVTSIGYEAFCGCTSLTSITLPESLTSIGERTFENCTSLASITIPKGVTSIDYGAFCGCTSLTSITLPFVGATKDGTRGTHFGYIFGASNYYNNGDCVPASLKTVVITGGESIGRRAFYGCTGLTSITIPKSVTSIGDWAFDGCYKLIEVINHSSLNITAGSEDYGYVGYYAKHIIADPKETYLTIDKNGYIFYDDGTNVYLMGYTGGNTTLILPEKSPSEKNYVIYSYAFWKNAKLTNIEVPTGITGIGKNACDGCTNLTYTEYENAYYLGNDENPYVILVRAKSADIEFSKIHEETRFIYESAFKGCKKLVSITIPDSVIHIGFSAFEDCASLENITLPFVGESRSETENTHFGYIFGADSYWNNDLKVPSSLKNVVITKVEAIEEYAFTYCRNLQSITIPENVNRIGSEAFRGCSSLTHFTISENVTDIGSDAFLYCEGLRALYISDLTKWCAIKFENHGANPLALAHDLYLNGKLIKDLVIPQDVKSIASYAFYGSTSIVSVTIPESVTNIGCAAFKCCENLERISLPFIGEKQDGTGNTRFDYIFCDEETYYNIPESLKTVVLTTGTSIGDGAFKNCRTIESITIPEEVKSIGNKAFAGCYSLANFSIPRGVTSIGNAAFIGCNFTSFVIPEGVTSIGEETFAGCSALISFTISKGVTSIGSEAFRNCTSLTSITIPKGVTSIGKSAFYGCTGLESIVLPFVGGTMDASGQNCCFGYIFGADFSNFNSDFVPSSLKTVVITGGTSIAHSAFYGCSNIESITLPFVGERRDGTGNTKFGHIFCSGYSDYNRYNCDNRCVPQSLKTVVITGGTSIDNYAFSWCESLTSITLPESVTSIGEGAFSGCTGLKDIYYAGSESEWNAISKGGAWNTNTGNYTIHYNYVPAEDEG